jgi:hypothetical protein
LKRGAFSGKMRSRGDALSVENEFDVVDAAA